MSVRHSEENLANLATPGNICSICNEETTNFNFVATPCMHGFHRSCLTIWLTENESCPLCRRTVDSQSLRSFTEQDIRPVIDEAPSQGAVRRGPVTRLQAFNYNTLNRSNPEEMHSPANNRRGRNNRQYRNENRQASLDLGRIQQMIEDTTLRHRVNMTREISEAVSQLVSQSIETRLQNLSLTNERSRQDTIEPQNLPNLDTVTDRRRSGAEPAPNSLDLRNPNISNVSINNGVNRDGRNLSPEAISKIIINWKLTFDGSLENVSVDEFIYRINALTVTSLRGNFDALCQNAHILFEGKAKNWYWRYHHSVRSLDWFNLCDALKSNFKDVRTDYDIKERIRNRKQKQGESFEQFFEALMTLSDSLKVAMSEQELVETLIRNILPDIRLELLHLDITSISALRRACRRRENFFETVKNSFARPQLPQKRQLAEVEQTDQAVSTDFTVVQAAENLDALEKKCWNCDAPGHDYKQCVKPRRVFCYGCGLLAYFLPTCPNCNGQGNKQRGVYNHSSRHPNPTSE
ncbi:uncharacterized protein [Eurosta solidaginis]|uniref:uncharacterized protein n=1 Tax=Eurosta solidaginis TaxID=178769 RepID=UPI0035311A4C